MSESTDARIARTSTASGATARTEVTTAARGGAFVRFMVRATRAWGRVAEGARRAVRWAGQTITPAGWLIIAAALGGLATGLAFGWVEALVAGIAALMLLALAMPFLFGARAYSVQVVLEHERVVAGGEVSGEVLVRNIGARTALPGRLDLPVGDGLIEVGLPLLRPGHTLTQALHIPTPRRGIVPVGPAVAVRSDPIGLFRREHAWEERRDLHVHPRTVVVPSTSAGLVRDLEGRPTRRLVDADMSFHAIREYLPGDSRRQIHWKSTAKTGRLMVRQFEESRRSRMAVVLGLWEREFLDADEFELAVSAAASLGSQAMRDGRDLEVVLGAEVPRVARGRVRAIRRLRAAGPRGLLDGFCPVEPLESTTPITEVCRLTAEESPDLSIAFLVCGSAVPAERLRRAALAFGPDTAVIAVVCDERAHPRSQVRGGLTVLTIGVLEDLSALMLRGASA